MAQRRLTEQEMEYNFARATLIWKNLTRIFMNLLRFGCISWCVYWFFDAVKIFAGEETNANVLINLVVGMKIDKLIAYLFGGGGLLYGGIRNYQIKQTRKNLSEHIRKLEKMHDKDRQKSRLNEYGETHEDDR